MASFSVAINFVHVFKILSTIKTYETRDELWTKDDDGTLMSCIYTNTVEFNSIAWSSSDA